MVTDLETENRHGGGDGLDSEGETQEQLDAAAKKLRELARPDGSLVTLSRQELSLLKQILMTATEDYRGQTMWRMCDFMNQEEALDHVSAYYEAKELGMDTSFNVSYMFALCSTNRKENRNNLIAQILDTLQHGKWATSNRVKGNKDGNGRSPLAGD